ncbi:nucleotidyltransferase domain-containing protein [Pseudomonas brenneri]|uniref:nucleotidyltransferase domain-containing protein n=1 Tax=Pseudomonas brenneri TaxID=129817 RepID=UPI0028D7315B|nr:amino acid transporter [Pseudomonas brenneri]
MKDRVVTPNQELWNSWTPAELDLRLKTVSRPWCVVGGWALDLWRGEKTREHDDIEFTMLRDDFPVFRHALGDLDMYTAKSGVLTFLPVGHVPGLDIQQVWCFDPVAQAWRVDMMIESGSPEVWVYKRDGSIRFPRAKMLYWSSDGIPYLRPAAILLFKAQHVRTKDEEDFHKTLPTLPDEEVAWLRQHLLKLHPGHHWITPS